MSSVPPPAPDPPETAPSRDVAAEAGAAAYRVQLPSFEGPLDLLLHLIEEHELDIRDIPIAFVAQKYVEYITLMDQLNIDVASEYLVMAATLAHIKSKMLLPAVPDDQEDEEEAELDPRAELVRRLLEYQKYKNAAEQLASHPLLGRDVFPRGMPAPDVDGPAPLAGLSLFKLLDAFQSVLSRAKATIDHQIDFERFSITDRINELSDLLRLHRRLPFDELFQGQRTRLDLIITFLALLEMTRLRLTRLFQEGPLEVIIVELAVTEDAANASFEGDELYEGDEPHARVRSAESAEDDEPHAGDDAELHDGDEPDAELDENDEDAELDEEFRGRGDGDQDGELGEDGELSGGHETDLEQSDEPVPSAGDASDEGDEDDALEIETER